jgi:hypothetical protein
MPESLRLKKKPKGAEDDMEEAPPQSPPPKAAAKPASPAAKAGPRGIPGLGGEDKPYADVTVPVRKAYNAMFPEIPEGGFSKEQYTGATPIPSRDAAAAGVALAGGPRSPGAAAVEQKDAGTEAIRVQAHDVAANAGNTPATDLSHPTKATPTSPQPAGAAPERPAPPEQTYMGGTTPQDYGRVSAVVGPTGKKTYGDTGTLGAMVKRGEAGWSTKPQEGRGVGVEVKGGPALLGNGATRTTGETGFMGIRRGAPSDPSVALAHAAASGTPFSEQLRGLSSDSEDPMQRAEYRDYLNRRIEEEKARELGDVEQQTKIATNEGAQARAAVDPLAAARIEAQGKYGDAYIKAQTEANTQASLAQQLAPLMKAYMDAKQAGDQQKLLELQRIILALYGRTPPAQSPQAGFFGMTMPTPGGAPAAEPVK